MQAALHLFAHQGYHGTTLDQIARQASVSKGTILNNFSTKAGLYRATLDDVVDRVSAKVATTEELVDSASPYVRLVEIVRGLLTIFDADPTSARLLIRELTPASPRPDHMKSAVCARVVGPVHGALREWRDDGRGLGPHAPDELTPDGPLPIIATALVGSLAVAAIDRRVNHPDQNLDEVAQAYVLSFQGFNVQSLR